MQPSESSQERVERRENLAFEAGQRKAIVDGKLDSHEARLNKMNGSVDRFNEALGQIDRRMEAMERAFGEWTAVAKAVQRKGLDTRTFLLTLLAIVIPLLIAFEANGGHL